MKKFLATILMLAFSGVAFAQPAPPPGSGTPPSGTPDASLPGGGAGAGGAGVGAVGGLGAPGVLGVAAGLATVVAISNDDNNAPVSVSQSN